MFDLYASGLSSTILFSEEEKKRPFLLWLIARSGKEPTPLQEALGRV